MIKSEVIRTLGQFQRIVRKMQKLDEFAFDTETNTLRVNSDSDEFKIVGISISWSEYDNYYIPLGHVFDEDQLPVEVVAKGLKPIFEREDVRIIGHNLKYDLHVLARIGIHVKTLDLFDTMIASWICDENTPNGLKDNTSTILGIDQTKIADVFSTVTNEEKKSVGLKANNKATFDLVRIDVGSPYAIADSYYTWKLYLHFLDKLEQEGMEKIYFTVYPQFLTTLYRMEERGITLDIDRLREMDLEMARDIEDIEYQLLEIAGCELNLGSTQQLCQLLFGYSDFKSVNQTLIDCSFGLKPVGATKTGVPSASANDIKKLSKQSYKNRRKQEGVEFCKLLLEHRKLTKLKTFVTKFEELVYKDGRIHCNFNIIGTDSGRISCSDPNLQQIPNSAEDDKYNLRELFMGGIDKKTGKRKHIISVDYSNLEVRVIAHFSQDPNLINAFLEGKDLHGNTAKMMFRLDCDANEVKKLYPQLRQQGKVIAFLLQYGGSAFTLAESLNANGELDDIAKTEGSDKNSDFYGCNNAKEVAQRLMDLYFTGFKGIADFMKSQKKFAHRNGCVYTVIGRKRRLPMINSSNYGDVGYAERLSINSCIQGSGADIMMNAQNKIEGTSPYLVSDDYTKEENTTKFEAAQRLKELGCEMLVQIHDELLFECPEENCQEAMKIIRDCMINPFGEDVKLNLPLEVGMASGLSYACGH